MFPFCLSLSLPSQDPKTISSSMKGYENNYTLPTYIILKLCFKAQERGGCSVLSIYPLYIAEALKLND